MPSWTDSYLQEIERTPLVRIRGSIEKIVGLIIESRGPAASIGELCKILDGEKEVCLAEVVGFRKGITLVMPLGGMEGIRPGMGVETAGKSISVPVGNGLLGRVLDGLGNPMDGKGPLNETAWRSVHAEPPNAMERTRITEPMYTGVRSIDGFLTIGRGQRMGIFAGSGVGKSVTMGMIARNCLARVNVIALVGERGREVREFIEKDLGEEGLAKSVVIVATSDQPALVRLKASLVATAIAEHFRDQGEDVLLMMDSTTRLAMAQREVGLAAGEPPATKGYPPSVFGFLPKLFERAGCASKGSITGLYTVLVEGDDMDDPIADSVRSILDGHIVLNRDLATRGHYPAVDVLQSISRCRTDVISDEMKGLGTELMRSMAVYKNSEDLVTIGAYARGSDAELDRAIERRAPLEKFLIQQIDDHGNVEQLENDLRSLVEIGS